MNKLFGADMNQNHGWPSARRAALKTRIAAFLNQAPLFRGVQSQPGFSSGSVKGPVRKENQDRALVVNYASRGNNNENIFIAIICDGMGGLEQGGEAATLAASAFIAELATGRGANTEERLRLAVLEANRSVFEKLKGRGGTTLTALVISDSNQPWSAHVGDSRLYLRDRVHGQLSQATRDDTLEAVLSNQDHENYDDSGRGLLQYVGMGDDLQPHVDKIGATSEQLFILTTDGAHNTETQTFRAICREARNTDDLTKRLLLVAEAIGAKDNASAICVIPSRLIPDEPFQTGLSINAWTPWDRLNIWIPDDLSPHRVDEHIPERVEQKTRQGKAAKPSGKKNKTKKKITNHSNYKNGSENDESVVQIEFDHDGDYVDKTSR